MSNLPNTPSSRYVALDEVDRLLSMGFKEQVCAANMGMETLHGVSSCPILSGLEAVASGVISLKPRNLLGALTSMVDIVTQVDAILGRIRPDRQMVLFSATCPASVQDLIQV